MNCDISDIFWFIFSMVLTRGSSLGARAGGQDRPRLIDDQIGKMIAAKVATVVRGSIPELFGSIKTTMSVLLDDRYAALSKAVVVAVGIREERVFQYRDFNNTKPLVFDGAQDSIMEMRWFSDVEGCFFTCSCPVDHKVKWSMNLFQSGEKDWWRLVTGSYTPKQRVVVTSEQFYEMFCMRYVQLVERKRLGQEYLDLR